MEDDLSDSEDALEVASKTWYRVNENAKKTGYREGLEDGSESVFQQGFDKGYEDAFKVAFELGRYKGLATVLSKDLKHPEEIEALLEKSRRGACFVCFKEKQLKPDDKVTDNSKATFEEIVEDQKQYSLKILNDLREHFSPLLQDCGVGIDKNLE